MKLQLTLILVIVLLSTMKLHCQDIELGAGFGYGTQIGAVSFNIRSFYKLKKGIEVGPNFQFSLINKSSDEFVDYGASRQDYSVLARYELEKFDLIKQIRFYPLLGISLINLKYSGESKFSNNPILQVEDSSDLFLGFLAGIGAKYQLSALITLYGEAGYHISKEAQALLNVGIVYKIHLPFAKNE